LIKAMLKLTLDDRHILELRSSKAVLPAIQRFISSVPTASYMFNSFESARGLRSLDDPANSSK
jgi:hypothetical protein